MDLPQGQVGDHFWQNHVEQKKKSKGTFAAYCRQHNIDYDQFVYHKNKILTQARSVELAKPGFAKVQAASVATKKSYPQLPDPKWVAELIHNLVREIS